MKPKGDIAETLHADVETQTYLEQALRHARGDALAIALKTADAVDRTLNGVRQTIGILEADGHSLEEVTGVLQWAAANYYRTGFPSTKSEVLQAATDRGVERDLIVETLARVAGKSPPRGMRHTHAKAALRTQLTRARHQEQATRKHIAMSQEQDAIRADRRRARMTRVEDSVTRDE